MNQILSVIAKFRVVVLFRTVTPTYFPPCGLFSRQVIKLLECSTDSKKGGFDKGDVARLKGDGL